MDAFVLVHLLDEVPDLGICVGEVLIVRQVHLLFLDGTDQPLGVAIFFGLADGRHANLHAVFDQQVCVGRRSVLYTLIAVMDMWPMVGQGTPQGAQRQLLVQRAA